MAALAGWVLLTAASPCLAQAWPTRTVKVVVPYASGGITDTMARVTADRLGKVFGQTFYIENKAGAGGAFLTERDRLEAVFDFLAGFR